MLEGHKIRAKAALSSAEAQLKEQKDTLHKLRSEVEKDERVEAARRKWLGLFRRRTAEQQEVFDREMTARRTGLLVFESRVTKSISEVEKKQKLLVKVTKEIGEVFWRKSAADYQYFEARMAEQKRRDEEQRKRSERDDEERHKREQAAREAKARRRRERAEARQREKEAARARRAQQEDLRKKEELVDESHGSHTRVDETDEPVHAQEHGTTKDSEVQFSLCQHRAWWKSVPGPGRCEFCERETPRFAFQCPECEKRACAPCRVLL